MPGKNQARSHPHDPKSVHGSRVSRVNWLEMLLSNPKGGYSFLRGIGPYSRGVIAASGFTIEHVRVARSMPWRQGFEFVDTHLRAAGRPRAALCAMALRSPAPFTFE